jgi:imidazolonepropionase
MQAEILIRNVRLPGHDYSAARSTGASAVALSGSQIHWLGDEADAPVADEIVDGGGGWLTPGLIDCHTHLVYAGSRAQEFEERLQGVPYEEIARRGGGILSTVEATRRATEEELFEQSLPRLLALAREGVCTVEIKSGYGLDCDNELKMLRVARALARHSGLTVTTTLLAAHALPPEFSGRADAYIDQVCDVILPAAHAEGLVDAVDVFCESIGFTPLQCEQVFRRARDLGLPVKGHVEQLSHSGGAALVASYRGLSVDHIEYLDESDIDALVASGCVCVLLPGAFYTLNETRMPPLELLREAGLPIAVASDLNPGSSPMASLLLNMNMACVLFGLTPAEALQGVTRHAAAALGLGQCKGAIAAGMDADLVLWDIEHPAELSYGHGLVRPRQIWRGGRSVAES